MSVGPLWTNAVLLSSKDAPERTESAPADVLVMVDWVNERMERGEETYIMDPFHVQRSSSSLLTEREEDEEMGV